MTVPLILLSIGSIGLGYFLIMNNRLMDFLPGRGRAGAPA